MTKVFFYHNAPDRLLAASQLLAQASWQKKAVLIYVPEPALAQALDRQLWVHPPLSFTPHCPVNSPLAAETLLLLDDRLEMPPQTQRLMNFSHTLPPDYQRFDSLIEVVSQQGPDLHPARERYRQYKAAGCEVAVIDFTKKAA
jgi:DNA polymerase-3 subunit chi